jgi:hypothetical protein
MKKLIFRTLTLGAVLAFMSLGVQAASYDAGGFDSEGDSWSTSSLEGNFLDTFNFSVGADALNIVFSGSHVGMYEDDLLLTNLNTNEQYHLGTMFNETFSLATGDYVFAISGFALNAVDSSIHSDYDLTMSAVPLPAAAWLFGSALLGFVSYSRRRKI